MRAPDRIRNVFTGGMVYSASPTATFESKVALLVDSNQADNGVHAR
jgi:hypothetical protein